MWIEGILVRERLLGPANEEYADSIRYQGAAFADRGKWHRAIALWLFELDLCRQHGTLVDVVKLRSFVAIFCDMLSSTLLPPVEALQIVINETLAQLETDFDAHLHTLLFLITITSQVVVSFPFRFIYSIRSDPRKRRHVEYRSNKVTRTTPCHRPAKLSHPRRQLLSLTSGCERRHVCR